VERKLCAGCGCLNLETEIRCWACGGIDFAPPGTPITGERTISLADGAERTMSWDADRQPQLGFLYLAGGIAFACFMAVVGFWIGRASAPEGEVLPPQPSAAGAWEGPVPLPTPPTALKVAPAPGASQAPPVSIDPPVVVIQPKPAAPPRPSARTARGGGPAPSAAGAPVQQPPNPSYPPMAQAPQRRMPRIVYQGSAVTPPPASSGSEPAFAPPTSTRAIVRLRNDDTQPIDVILEGNGSRSRVQVAPGSVIPLALSPGIYALRAAGRGASSAQSSLAVTPNRTYSLIVDRSRDGGAETLVLIEPAVDGQAG
jgi:hypothetical protein